MDYNFCVPCLLGLEGPISDEPRRLDIPGVRAENGRVYFTGGGEELARANINLRIGERILLSRSAASPHSALTSCLSATGRRRGSA